MSHRAAQPNADPQPPAVTKTRRSPLRALLVVSGVLAGLAIGETAVRLFRIGPTFNVIYSETYRFSDNPDLEYELVPGAESGEEKISSQALRDREFPLPKPEDVFRIAVVGDSITYGLYCMQSDPYSKQLERLLNLYASPGQPRFEVLNLGVSGYNITQVVERLRVRGLPFEPDLVIYGYVVNDPQTFSLELAALETMRDQAERSLRRDVVRGVGRLASHSKLFLILRQLWIRPPSQPRTYMEDPGYPAFLAGKQHEYFRLLHLDEASWQSVCRGMAKLGRITRSRHIPVGVAIFPIGWGTDRGGYPLADVHARVAAQARQNGLEVIDLLPAYRALRGDTTDLFFNDLLHPNQIGHYVAAMALLKWLCGSNHLPGDGITFDTLLKGRPIDAACAAALTTNQLAAPRPGD